MSISSDYLMPERYNILCVDDEPDLLEITKRYLERGGLFSVVCALSGEEALEKIASGHYDAVISDYQMPGMNGITLLKKVRENNPTLPFILFTGRGREEVVIEAINSGVDFYLQKGGDPVAQYAELSLKISTAADRRNSEKIVKESGEQYRSLVETTGTGYVILDSNGRVVTANQEYLRLTGRAVFTDIEGKHVTDWTAPNDLERYAREVESCFRTGRIRNLEIDYLKPDSSIQPIEINASVVLSGTDRIILTLCRDITEHRSAKETLLKSEARVRKRLESLQSPTGDITSLDLSDIIDVPTLQSLMDDFTRLTGMVTAILDINGKVLVATGWQDICTRFHRVNPVTSGFCTKSDLYLSKNTIKGEYVAYKCSNNLWDVVTPLYIGERHMGNIFTGQFFYDDDIPDESVFIAQAGKYGFDLEEYLAALHRVPRFSRQKVNETMNFLVRITDFISRLSFSNLSQARTASERNALLHTLQESERKFRIVVEHIPDKLFVKDAALTYVTCNEHYARDLGIAADTITGMTDFDLHPRELAEKYRADDRAIISSGIASTVEEKYVINGKEFWISTSKTPVKDDEGNITGIIGLFHDITERKLAEDALMRVNRKLNVLNHLTRRDLSSQIFVLKSYLDLAKISAAGEDSILKNLQKTEPVIQSINDITEFTRDYQSMGENPPRWQNVNLALLFGISHIMLGKISHSLDTGTLEIFTDPLLEKAFQGLFENTIAHGNTTTRIQVFYRVIPEGVIIIFEDDGSGIPLDMKERIFSREESIHSSVRGLFFVREILDLTGITIRETGEPGKGARFEIIVPKISYRISSTG